MPILDFKGKQIVYAHHLGVPYHTLDMARKKSVLPKGGANNETNSEGNLVVHGDNLQALKALMPRYAGRGSVGKQAILGRRERDAIDQIDDVCRNAVGKRLTYERLIS